MATIDRKYESKRTSSGGVSSNSARKKSASGLYDAALSGKVASILSSNAPSKYKMDALKNSPDAKEGEAWWQTGLNLIGKPKTLVVASLRRAIDPNANWAKDVSNNVGFGKIVEKSSMPDWLKGTIGLVGDVALDPLTYLGVGVADDALKMGGKGASLFMQAAKYSEMTGKADDALKFATAGVKAAKGLSKLTTAERGVLRELATSEATRVGTKAALGSNALKESGGLFLNVPGTGMITNKLRQTVGITPVAKRQLKLLGQSDALSAVPRAFRGGEELARGHGLGKAIGKAFNDPEKLKLINAVRRGDDPMKAANAFIGLKAMNVSPVTEAKFVREAAMRFNQMVDDLDAAGVAYDDVTRSAGGDTNAFGRIEAAMGTEKAIEAQEFSRNLGRMYNDILGVAEGEVGAIPIRDFHAATMRSEELKQHLLQTGGKDTYDLPGAVKGGNFEKKAMAPGDTFLEKQLVVPADHPQGLSIPDQMEDIAKGYWGDDYVKMFNQDFKEATKAQINAMGRRIRVASVEKNLREAGVAKDLFETVETASAAVSRKKLNKLLKKLPAVQQNNVNAYLEVENSKQALDTAEALVTGSKEQAAVWRAEARVSRLSQTLLGEDSSDPILKGFHTQLRNATTAEEAALAISSIQDEVIRQFPDEANQILRPLRDAFADSQKNISEAFGKQQKFGKMLDELQANRAKAVEYHAARSTRINQYADLLVQQKDLRIITNRMLDEISNPVKYGTAERDALTRQMQSTAKGLTDQLEAIRTMRAMLEAPELMTGPMRTKAFAASDVIDEKTGRIANAGVVKGSTVGKNASGGDADVALMYFLEHPNLDQNAVGLKKLVGESVTLEDLNNRQIAAVVKEANRLTDDLQRQVETASSALQKRLATSPQMGIQQARAKLDDIAARLEGLGQDDYVAYLGDLKARLPEVTSGGRLRDPMVHEQQETALNWARSQDVWGESGPPSPDEFLSLKKQMSVEGVMDNYLFSRAQSILQLAERSGAIDDLDPALLDEIFHYYEELGPIMNKSRRPPDPMVPGKQPPGNRKAIEVYTIDEDASVLPFDITPETTGPESVFESVRHLNYLVDEHLREYAYIISNVGDNGVPATPWVTGKFYHGGSTANPLNLTVSGGGANFPNADSMAGVHWTMSEGQSSLYAGNAQAVNPGSKPMQVHAELAPKNSFVYGPHSVDLEVGTPFNFDVMGQGEWVGGRAVYFGDILRDGVKNNIFSRKWASEFITNREQKAFWNTVHDVFEETGDAAEALRRAASAWEDTLTPTKGGKRAMARVERNAVFQANLRMKGGYQNIEGYDNQLVDHIARELFAAHKGVDDKSLHPLLKRLTGSSVADATYSYNNTLKAMGYDSIAYPLGLNKGWSIISIDPAIVKVLDVTSRAGSLNATKVLQFEGPGGKLIEITRRGKKALAFDLHDAQRVVTKQMRAEQDALISTIDDAAKKVGTVLDNATAEWKNADINLYNDRSALMEAESNAQQKFDDLISERYISYNGEVDLRKRAVRFGELIEERTAVFQAEMAQATAQGRDASKALGDLRAELGVLQLERDFAAASADLAKSNKQVLTMEQAAGKLRSKKMETQIVNVLEDGFRQLGMGSQAPADIVDAITAMAKIRDPKQVGIFLKTFDFVTQAFKSWAIATPGFHFRNYMGGVFNNFLAGVDIGSYSQFRKVDRFFQKAIADGVERTAAYSQIGSKYGQLTQEAYEVAERSFAFNAPGQIGSTGLESGIGSSSANWRKALTTKGERSFIIDNPATRLNLHASEYVERQLRGTLAFDYAMKGANKDEVLDAVYKFHFNYEDLSAAERNIGKRVMPFYTWTRKNLPLQIEMLISQPKYYARIGYAKNEMEMYSEQEALVPSWFNKTLNIRMPFKNPMGEQMYIMPQLPPTDLMKLRNPREFLGMVNPVLKVPAEAVVQKKLYNDVPFKEGMVPVPSSWNKLGIGKIMEMAGRATTDKDGNIVAKDSDIYAVESFIPLLGRARRLFPSDSQESEAKYSNRVTLSWANMVFGLGFTANTQSDKSGELYRRTKAVDTLNKKLSTMGYGGYKTLTKDVGTKAKPAKGEKSPFLIVAQPKGGAGSSYATPKKGQSGNQALKTALGKLKSSNSSSPELQQMIANLQKASKK
jgi:hypothetical protein